VTANHVVERDENVRVALSDGRIVDATVVGRDRNTDLAVLRAEGASLTVPTWAGLDDVKVGHLVLALGRAGESLQASLGIVSAVGEFVEHGRSRSRRRSMESKDRFIQTDVTMYPGFSGGPL